MSLSQRRLVRERKTIKAMVVIYCRGVHGQTGGLCRECEELFDYASKRLERCPFQEDKPTCVNCPIHCYQADLREKIKTIMRYAGPRMLHRHPILAIRHMIDAHRKAPPETKPKQ